ncbi:tetratricopeptide repeat protein [Candidatus Roizmanbacteria bacterium]|nr:tetratricopeptide repeat protein [Candidatus Roizmanbacteria bacterium]
MNDIELLEQQAVDAAVNYNWQLAIEINKEILSLDKKNLAVFLRLGFAYLQLQKFDLAKKFYRKALKIQPNNNVAKENLDRIKVLESKSPKKNRRSDIYLDPNLFLEIPGKTKNVTLVNLGQKNILAQLSIGQEVFLKPKKRKVEVRTKEKEYIGSLPDDLSRRLLVFLKAKSIYSVFIKEANLSRVALFIREFKKGKKVQSYLSFPHNIQANIQEMNLEKEPEEESDEVTEGDLEKLAESLTSEEKEYLPYVPEKEEEDEE